MGLFDRYDGRDYRGYGRREGLGDRARGAWHRFEDRHGMRGGYDREPRGGRGYDASDFAYRGMEGAWSTAWNRGAHDPQWDWRHAAGSDYDQDLRRHEGGGYGRGFAWREAGARGGEGGDPFGDRQRRTPFHLVRGGFGRGRQHPDRYDVHYRGWNRGVGDEPAYRGEDFRGWDGGRGRDARRW